MNTMQPSRTFAELLAEEAPHAGDVVQFNILKKRLLIPLGVASALISIPEFDWTSPQQMAGRMTDTLLAGLSK